MIEQSVHIVASPFKTGTSSIAAALSALGVGTAAMPYRSDLLATFAPTFRMANRLARSNGSFGAFQADHGTHIQHEFRDLLCAIEGFDVFHDAPIGHSHLHPFVLKTLMPGARLIWVKRPKDDWLASVRNWETSHPETYPDHARWDVDPDDMIARKIRRRMGARRAFAAFRRACPADALVLEWGDLGRFDKLAEFYRVGLPTGPFPHCNRS